MDLSGIRPRVPIEPAIAQTPTGSELLGDLLTEIEFDSMRLLQAVFEEAAKRDPRSPDASRFA